MSKIHSGSLFLAGMLLVSLTAILILLSGCLPAPAPTQSNTAQLESLAEPTVVSNRCDDPGGPVTVNVHDWSSTDRQKYWDQVIAGFNESHPCIQAVSIKLPADRLMRMNELATGVAPDLVGFDSSDLPLVARKKYLLDLTPLMEKDHFLPQEHFYESVYQTGFVDGKPVAIAKDYSVSAFYVNTDLLKNAGIEIPQEGWTYEDYLKIAQKLTVDQAGNNVTSPFFDPNNVAVWGTSLPQWGGGTGAGWWRGFQTYLYSWGAHTISPDGKTVTGYINSENAVKAWTWYRDLIHKYQVVPMLSPQNAAGIINDRLFGEGKIAISGSFWGPWYQDVFNQTPGLHWKAVPLPSGPGGHRAAIMWMGWGINEKSQYPEQAWQLLKWLATDPGQSVFALKALTQDMSVAQELQIDQDPFWGVFLAEVPYQDSLDDMTTPFYTTCVDTPASQLLAKLYQETGVTMNIRSELDKLAVQMDRCLGENQSQ
jgi:multiple sugar transport system substrate-binding protein